MDWRLTDKTQDNFILRVRQGAVRDAVDKAVGYCSAFSSSQNAEWECEPKEISDVTSGSSGGFGGAAPRARMHASRSAGGGGGEGETLNFEPEDVSLSASVNCKFECYQKSN